jgi:hypothetical protein
MQRIESTSGPFIVILNLVQDPFLDTNQSSVLQQSPSFSLASLRQAPIMRPDGS